MEIYKNCYYETFIKKNREKEGYIGFIGKKVAFLPKNFTLPPYLTEGRYDILGEYIDDKGNYFIINKIELPSMYEVIGIPKIAFKNNNVTTLAINDVIVKIANNYIEFEFNGNKCNVSLFKRAGNKRNVDMTLLNVNGHFNILNDTNPFCRNGQLNKSKFNEIIKILNCKYTTETVLYLISEMMWLSEDLYKEEFDRVVEIENDKVNNNDKKDYSVIKELTEIYAYSNWSIGTYNLNIPIADEELRKII